MGWPQELHVALQPLRSSQPVSNSDSPVGGGASGGGGHGRCMGGVAGGSLFALQPAGSLRCQLPQQLSVHRWAAQAPRQIELLAGLKRALARAAVQGAAAAGAASVRPPADPARSLAPQWTARSRLTRAEGACVQPGHQNGAPRREERRRRGVRRRPALSLRRAPFPSLLLTLLSHISRPCPLTLHAPSPHHARPPGPDPDAAGRRPLPPAAGGPGPCRRPRHLPLPGAAAGAHCRGGWAPAVERHRRRRASAARALAGASAPRANHGANHPLPPSLSPPPCSRA